MPSASRALHSTPRRATPAIAHGLAEKRSGYSDNSTVRTAPCRAAKTTVGEPEGMAPFGRRWPTLASCCVLVPRLATRPEVACCPTRANVAYRPAVPQQVGTWRRTEKALGRGSRHGDRGSLLRLSGFSIAPRPGIEVT